MAKLKTSNLPTWLRLQPVAHRGLHYLAAGIPENSRAAFQAAIEAGYAIECDVRLSRDGVPMVFHDAALDRLCGRTGLMNNHDAATLGRFTLLGTKETIPTLGDLLDMTAGRVPLLVEVKNYNDAPVGPLESSVKALLDQYKGNFAVQSFNPRTVAWFENHAPNYVRGQIACPIADMGRTLSPFGKVWLWSLLCMGHGSPHFIAYDVNHLPAALTKRARKKSMPVLTWTVKTPQALAKARQYADNIIFEAQGRP